MATFLDNALTMSRKRKQEDLPTGWSSSDYYYHDDFDFATMMTTTTTMDDPVFQQQDTTQGAAAAEPTSSSRRHSVAVGELDYHSFEPVKQEIAMRQDEFLLFGGKAPSSPSFFSPSFLDALNADLSDDLLSTSDGFTVAPAATTINNNNNSNDFSWLNQSPISTSSPSPPITPVFEDQEQEEQQPCLGASTSSNSNSLVTARMLQTAGELQPHLQQYLLNQNKQGERTVTILTSKVAQKSYGTEKRFLCPPPTTILSGTSWWTTQDVALSASSSPPTSTGSALSAPPNLTIQISGEQQTNKQTGVLEWTEDAAVGKCVSKHLHISDADEKRKRVEVLVKMQLANGVSLGTLASKGIKVISKPSKKRQSVKNMELCIHHGTTISLFNRIRSQTVSTKYLGVSNTGEQSAGTCFVARTGSWDPFVIWIVDTARATAAPDMVLPPPPPASKHHPTNPHYPPPPAIALQTNTDEPLAIHYNQAVVLQCVTTGLVSPVMVIRKVDKGSMVLGGNRTSEQGGGECGDEALGDPVSQLHKVAFQIVQDPMFASFNNNNSQHHHLNSSKNEWILPQSSQPVTYLACLNDVVGMHKTTTPRTWIGPSGWNNVVVVEEEKEKIIRKRRVSCDVVKPPPLSASFSTKLQQINQRRRVNSLSDVTTRHSNAVDNGACWTEDVSDAAVWTIVGTDCATYTFWVPPFAAPPSPITPFPIVHQVTLPTAGGGMTITGENLTRDLTVWLGDIQCPLTTVKSRESLACQVPPHDLLLSSPVTVMDEEQDTRKLPILLVRADGVVYRTTHFYSF